MVGRWVAIAASISLLIFGCGRTDRNGKPGAVGGTGAVSGNEAGSPGAGGVDEPDADGPDCAVQLAAHDSRFCAVYQDGSAWCWGSRPFPENVPGNFEPSTDPRRVEGLDGIEQLVLGRRHGCAIDKAQRVWCWGDNESGQVDPSQSESPLAPTRIDFDAASPIAAIGLNETQTCALESSRVWCWGTDAAGTRGEPQQVYGSPFLLSMPSGYAAVHDSQGQIFDLGSWSEARPLVALGGDNAWHGSSPSETCLLKRSGSLWCSEHSFADDDSLLYAKLELGESVVQAGVGDLFACALTIEGKVWCEGYNRLGQAGRGTDTVYAEGGYVPTLTNVSAIAVSHRAGCALTADGVVSCWGAYGAEGASLEPVQVSGCNDQRVRPPARREPGATAPGIWRVAAAGRARGQALCTCATELSGSELEECIRAETFVGPAACIAALNTADDDYYVCRADDLWGQAECFADCGGVGRVPDCPPVDCGAETKAEHYCRYRLHYCAEDDPSPLPPSQVCDAVPDCTDGSDELNCDPAMNAFECAPGVYIDLELFCDGTPECENGSDEAFCP